MDPSYDPNHYSVAEFKLALVTIEHNSHRLLFVRLPKHEKEDAEFQLEFSCHRLRRYYVDPNYNRERTVPDCENCEIIRHSVKIDPYINSTVDCPNPLEKAVLEAFVELQVLDSTNDCDDAIRYEISSVVGEAKRLADDELEKGRKKMGMEVKIMLWSDYVYDEEASMQLAATMLESTEEARLGFVPASRNSVDNLEKMKLNLDVFDGHDGYSCRICLEDMDIGGEVIRMPCSHVFHLSCIDEWLGTNHVCPLCRFELPVSICHA